MKRIISFLLCFVLFFSTFSALSVPVEAASSGITTERIKAVLSDYNYVTGRYWTHESGKSATSGYKSTTRVVNNSKTYNDSYSYNGVQCYGFANFVMHIVTDTSVRPSAGNTSYWTKISPKNVTELRVGDIVRIGTNDNYGHSGIVLTNSNGTCTFAQALGGKNNKITIGNALAGTKALNNNYKSYSTLKSMLNDNALVYVYRYTGKSIGYDISSVSTNKITNTSCGFDVKLNQSASVKKWTYFLSTDKSAVSAIDGTVGSTHSTTSKVDCVRILDYQSSPKTESSDSFTISKYQGSPLKANTTYYYKMTVYIGSTWYQSGVGSFKTAQDKPSAASLSVSAASKVVGIGDQVTLLWDSASGADSYKITVKDSNGSTVQTKTEISGLTCVLDGMNKSGKYTASITSVNAAGETAGGSAEFTVNPDLTVTFYDPVGETVISKDTVHYGHSADAPKNPVQEGHTFSKWDKAFGKVTENMTVNAVFDKNSYNVRFYDSFTGELLKKETVRYNESASAPSVKAPEGFALVSWDKDITAIKSDVDVYTIFKWSDKDNTATLTIDSVKRNMTKQGYDITVSIKNQIEEISSGRIVVVLKSENGVILTTAESRAFAVDALADKTVTTTILYSELAPVVEVYAVSGYDSLEQIAKTKTATIDNSTRSQWSEWITYTGNCPMTTGDGLVVEKRTLTDEKPEKSYYRYKVKETTTSTATSMSGFTQDGYNLVKASSGTIDYAPEWHSGFDTSHSLYSKYHVSPKSASESATQKVVINSNDTIGYIYWHWCRGESVGATNRAIAWNKTSTFKKFHAFYQAGSAVSYNSGANAYKITNKSVCNDTYWWNGRTSGTHALIYVKRQNYTIYNKVYNYYKLSDFTDWTEYSGSVPVSNGASAGTNKTYQNVETKTEPGETVYTYQYRYMTTSNPVINEPVFNKNQVTDITYNIGKEFAGKDATVWVYKYAQASDYTTEFVSSLKVGPEGDVAFKSAVLREVPSVESGDYSVVVSVAGNKKFIVLGEIKAPVAEYTVNFYDFDGKTVISSQKVKRGGTAVLPDKALLKTPAGQRFTTWNESVVNVKNDMNLYPESETVKYTVAFVDWNKRAVSFSSFLYGSELVAESLPAQIDGYTTEWVINTDKGYVTVDEFNSLGMKVSGNLVVETRSTSMNFTVSFAKPKKDALANIEDVEIMADDIFESQNIDNDNYIDFSNVENAIENDPDYIFYGWKNAYTNEYVVNTAVTEDMLLVPQFEFYMTADEPVISLLTGEYSAAQTVELTCPTENAAIWYTTDGSDPVTSETAIEYTAPITVSKSCQLKCYATGFCMNDSQVVNAVYAINNGSKKYHVVTKMIGNIDANYEPEFVLVADGLKLPSDFADKLYGYKYEELFEDELLSKSFNPSTAVINESKIIYVKYSPEIYTVRYIDFDGKVIATEKVTYLEPALSDVTPQRSGYVFIGWDNELDVITGDIDAKAMYIPESEYATVSLNRTRAISLNRGSVFDNLIATIEPDIHYNYELEWTSSNEAVATVDKNGVITANNVGTVIITVRIPYTNSTAQCKVNVTLNPDEMVTLVENPYINFDSERNLRVSSSIGNTVAEMREYFENEELEFYNADGETLGDNNLVGTGTKICCVFEGETTDTVYVALNGDANCDGRVNNKDVSFTTRYIVGKETAESNIQLVALDANGDGRINNRDATLLSRYLVGKETL